MASRHSNLKRIGEEGFRMLDQVEEKQRCLYHPTKPSIHYLQPPPSTQVQRNIVTPPPHINYIQPYIHKPSFTLHHQTMPNPDTKNTTSTHYNQHVTQVTPRDHQASTTGVMDCYEAARKFGGIVVTDYYPNNNNKKKVMMQRGSKAF